MYIKRTSIWIRSRKASCRETGTNRDIGRISTGRNTGTSTGTSKGPGQVHLQGHKQDTLASSCTVQEEVNQQVRHCTMCTSTGT
jgi:hypothetical protein